MLAHPAGSATSRLSGRPAPPPLTSGRAFLSSGPLATRLLVAPMRSSSGVLARVGPIRGGVVASASLGFFGLGFVIGSAVAATRMARNTSVHMALTAFNQAILAKCPSLTGEYMPRLFMNNPHVETIFAAWFRSKPTPSYRREFLKMPDGGTVALDWLEEQPGEELPPGAPTLVLLPGLTGGSHDSYVAHMVLAARRAGIRPVVFNSRGTSDSPVTSAQFYSASFTGDMRAVVKHVEANVPEGPLISIGWSLGANIMVRYLGEEGHSTPIRAAVSLCNPFDLVISDKNFEGGFNKVYDSNLAKSLKRILSSHREVFKKDNRGGKIDFDKAMQSKTIREFDEHITVGCFGWPDVDAYYAGSSSALSVPHVQVPLLCVQAENDPIAPREAIPYKKIMDNPNCMLVTTSGGGHLGWTSGPNGLFGEPWTDPGVIEFFQATLDALLLPRNTVVAEEEVALSMR